VPNNKDRAGRARIDRTNGCTRTLGKLAMVIPIEENIRERDETKVAEIKQRLGEECRIDHNDDWHGVGFGDLSTHEFRRHPPGTVTYHSLVGPVRVCRHTYRQCARNGVTYVPLELEVGIMERMTPGLAKCTAFVFSQLPIREAERLLHAAGRCPPSRATLDRSAKDLGAYAMVRPVVAIDDIRRFKTAYDQMVYWALKRRCLRSGVERPTWAAIWIVQRSAKARIGSLAPCRVARRFDLRSDKLSQSTNDLVSWG
jgi:hypothetical protein